MSDYEVPEVVDVHEPQRARGDAIDLDNRLRQLERMVAEAKIVPLSSSSHVPSVKHPCYRVGLTSFVTGCSTMRS